MKGVFNTEGCQRLIIWARLTSDHIYDDVPLIGYKIQTFWVHHPLRLYGLKDQLNRMVFKNGPLLINLKMSNNYRCNKIYNSLCVYWIRHYNNHKY